MRSALAVSVLALAALAAYPPEPQHPRDVVAAVAPHDPIAMLDGIEAKLVQNASEIDRTVGALGHLVPVKEHVASPEVLEVAPHCQGLQPFLERDLQVKNLPQLPAPAWRIVGPNRGAPFGVNVSRG